MNLNKIISMILLSSVFGLTDGPVQVTASGVERRGHGVKDGEGSEETVQEIMDNLEKIS